MTTILLDGDIFAYKHAAGSEVATDWGDDIWTLWTDMHQAIAQLEADLRFLVTTLKADAIEVALTGKENFRREVDPTYKFSRTHSRKPMGLPPLRKHLVEHWSAVIREPLEADDLLGIWATRKTFRAGTRKIIVSTDKDMLTIPCLLYNPNKAALGIQRITQEAADRYHLYQTLIGDSTDGYTGCPTIGPTRAERILTASPTWEGVVETYERQNLTEADALKQARLARILRSDDYDETERKVHYWKPQ
jgi:DNA polymerase-1